MRNRMIISGLFVFILLGTNVYAQQWPSATLIVEKVRTELNLDQKQFDTVKLIIEKNLAQRKQIWAESIQGPTLAQSEELRLDMYRELREVLTRYQMKQWNKILNVIEKDVNEAAKAEAKSNTQPMPVNKKK